MKVLHDAITFIFLSKWFHREPLTSEKAERRFFRLKKVKKAMVL